AHIKSHSRTDDVRRQIRVQQTPLRPVVIEDDRPRGREWNAPWWIGESRKHRPEVEPADVRLNLIAKQEIDEVQSPRIRMAFDEAGREDDGHQEPLPAEDREIEGDARPLVQIEQGDAFVAQRDIESWVGAPLCVNSRS